MPFFVIGNLKMNLLSEKDGEHYLSELRKAAYGKHFEYVVGVISPPFTQLARFTRLPTHFSVGAQDMHWEKNGPHTGSISPIMLRESGATFVILGHSDRRRSFGETDVIIKLKLDSALKHGLTPVVCLGESFEEREAGNTTTVIGRQLSVLLQGLSPMQLEKILFVYEPVWAISTSGINRIPSTTDIFQVKVFLRKWFTEQFDGRIAERMRILYGGSVSAINLGAVSWEAEMQGVLVGKESLFPREFVKIMDLAEQHFKSR